MPLVGESSSRGDSAWAEGEQLADIKRRLPLNPLKWAFISAWGQRGIASLVTLVLAAIVGPHSYGVIAMAMIYIVFLQLCVDQGISTALIQREELEEGDLDSAFWMNIAWCVVLTGISLALSGWWSRVNHVPELQNVINVLSLTIVVQGLTIVQRSVLQRDLRFKKLALRTNVAVTVGGIAGLTVAFTGGGVWALVVQQVVSSCTSVVLLWSISDWTPRFRFSPARARALLGFSIYVFLGNLANFITQRTDALLIGLFFGPLAVGVYRLADRLVEMAVTFGSRPTQVFSLSYFSRLQSDPEALRQGVRSCLRLTALMTVPAMFALAASSKYVIAAFGPKWHAAANVLLLLSLVGVAKALVLFTGPLLFAIGKPHFRTVMVWVFAALSTAAFIAVGVALRGKGVGDQVLGMAASRTLLFIVLFTPVNLIVLSRLTGLSIRSLCASLVPSTAAGAVGALGVIGLKAGGLLDALPAVAALAAAATTASVLALSTLMIVDRRVFEVASSSWGAIQRRVASVGGLAGGSA
jgi:polysaccharide transporter, PST family